MNQFTLVVAAFAALSGPSVMAQGLLIERQADGNTFGLGVAVRGTPDVNGDGYPDFLVTSRGPGNFIGRVNVYSGVDFTVLAVIDGTTNNAMLGDSIDTVGDIDHDGLCDLVLGAPGQSKAYIVNGNSGTVLFTLSDGGNGNLGLSVAGAGDVNGDGWPDVLAGAPDFTTWQSTVGRAYLYSGFNGSLIRMHEGTQPLQGVGATLAGGVDINLDGKSEYLIGDSKYPGAPTAAVRMYSGANGALMRTFILFPEPGEFGASIAFVDDVDNDGKMDVAVSSPGDSTVGLSSGRVDWFSTGTGLLLRTAYGASAGARFGTEISNAGDVDSDGTRDLWVSAPGANGTWGRIKLISGANLTELFSLQGIAPDFLPNVAGGFDFNLDGATDLVAGTAGLFRVYTLAPTRGAGYCTAKTNSQGCTPAMNASGTATRSGLDDFHLLASNVLNNKSGILIWSRTRAYNPFGGGNICLASPIFRRPLPPSGGSPVGLDCTGVYDYHLSHQQMNMLGMLAGDTVYTQIWSRDPGWSPPDNIGLSDGWEFTLGI